MTIPQAIQYLDNLRKIVLTVQGPNGPQACSGADHDIWRQAVDVLKCEHPEKPEPPPAPKPPKSPK